MCLPAAPDSALRPGRAGGGVNQPTTASPPRPCPVQEPVSDDELIVAVPAGEAPAFSLTAVAGGPETLAKPVALALEPAVPKPASAKAARGSSSKHKRRAASAWARVLRMGRGGKRKRRLADLLVPRIPSAGPEEAAASPRLRWAVRMSGWAPSDPEFEHLLGLLPEEQRAAITRLRQPADRERALASRLLVRAAAAAALGLSPEGVQVARTRGGKPYVTGLAKPWTAPNWNFSISHEVRAGAGAAAVDGRL